MARRRKTRFLFRVLALVLGVVLALVLALVAGLLVTERFVGHAQWTIRVTGRLVDGNGKPLAATPVMILPDESWRERAEETERWRTYEWLVGRTRADGSFELRVWALWRGRLWQRKPPPFYWTRLLRVDTSSGPVYVDCTKGLWTIDEDSRHSVTLDLGTVTLK